MADPPKSVEEPVFLLLLSDPVLVQLPLPCEDRGSIGTGSPRVSSKDGGGGCLLGEWGLHRATETGPSITVRQGVRPGWGRRVHRGHDDLPRKGIRGPWEPSFLHLLLPLSPLLVCPPLLQLLHLLPERDLLVHLVVEDHRTKDPTAATQVLVEPTSHDLPGEG